MDRARLFASVAGSSGILVRNHKRSGSVSGMVSGNNNGGNSQITLFKLTTSSGNGFEQPIGPGEQFSGVVVIQLSRPMPASQIVLELTAEERVAQSGKGSSKVAKSFPFRASLAVWTAVRKGTAASTVLSDGIHVFNFVCQMPYVNYPQTVHRAEFDIAYRLSGKLLAPGEGANAAEHVVAVVEKELFLSPVVTRMASPDPLLVVETLYFEKKGRRGKAAVELRAAIDGHQVVPGTKVVIDLSIRELASAGWTKVVARLIERTACRLDGQALSSQALWTVDHQLAYSEIVRSSVYNFFLNDEVMGKKQADTKTADGETVSSENLILRVPLAAAGHVNSTHLEFSHFLRLEVLVPSWLASERSVHVDIPVQIMTHTAPGAARVLNRQTSSGHSSLGDRQSQDTGSGSGSAAPSIRDGRLSHDACAAVVASLPPRYCDLLPAQCGGPELVLVTQANGGRRESAQSRATRYTMSSAQSVEMAMSPVLADILPPPPLPSAPMPTLDIGEPTGLTILTPAASGVSSPTEGAGGLMSPGKRRHNSGTSTGMPRTPVSPGPLGDTPGDASSDEDAGYFKSMGGADERPADRGLFRLRKNSSVKYGR